MKLKVALITQGLTRVVKPICESPYEIVALIDDAPRNYKPGVLYAFKRSFFLFMGRLQGKSVSLKTYAIKNNIPYFFYKKGGDSSLQVWLKDKAPDVMLVYSMSKLLKPQIFHIPKYGTINLHPSYLPEYPGRNPWFWIYANTDLNPGVTLHYIDEGEDTGDIIYQKRYLMDLGMESPRMQDIAIGRIGVNLMLKALEELGKKGSLPRRKQASSKKYPKAYQVKSNESIIDFETWPVERIWHLLRGTQLWYKPISQPTGIYSGQRWKVMGYVKKELNINNMAMLGSVVKKEGMCSLIAKDGEIQLRKTFSIMDFIKFILKK